MCQLILTGYTYFDWHNKDDRDEWNNVLNTLLIILFSKMIKKNVLVWGWHWLWEGQVQLGLPARVKGESKYLEIGGWYPPLWADVIISDTPSVDWRHKRRCHPLWADVMLRRYPLPLQLSADVMIKRIPTSRGWHHERKDTPSGKCSLGWIRGLFLVAWA